MVMDASFCLEMTALQGAAGQEAWQRGLLHCGTHLVLCRGTAAGAGCSTGSDVSLCGPRRIL